MDVAMGRTRVLGRSQLASPVTAIVIGLGVFAVGAFVVRDGTVSGIEEWAFRVVNDLPDAFYSVAWVLQVFGVLAAGPVVAVIAVVLRRYRLAVAAVAVTVLKLVTERVVKIIVSRQRPGTSIGLDIQMRGDVHATGESFVSGHAVLIAGLAGIVTPYLSGRWRYVPWVLVGAVMLGRVYVGAHNVLDVVCGAALGVAIAGAVNLALGVRPDGTRAGAPERAGHDGMQRHRVVGVALCGLLAVAPGPHHGRGVDGTATPALTDDAITVASFDFAESRMLAETYSQGLEAAGYRVVRELGLGPREFVGPALMAGLVELVPEYAGTAAEYHSLGAAHPSDDVAATHTELVAALADQPVQALTPAPAQDANTFVVTRATSERLGVTALSGLSSSAPTLTLGGPAECPSRQLCLAGLTDVYGLTFATFLALDAGGPLTVQALQDGQIDVALMFTTDPLIAALDLVELADDRGLQPAENITPLIRVEVVDRLGDDVVDVIDAVSARLTTSEVMSLNGAVGHDGVDIAAVVAAWWSEVAAS